MNATESASGRADRSLVALWRVVFEKEYIILRRYWFDTLAAIGVNYTIFVLLFLGVRTVVPAIIDGNLTAIIIGYFVWSMSWGSFQSSARTLKREAEWGTLEQTTMSPFGLFAVLTARIAAKLLFTLSRGVLILALLLVTTQHWISLDPVSLPPLVLVTMVSATGLGYAFGGLALVYKRVSSVFIIVQFLLIGAVGAPSSPLAKLLPLAWGTDLLVLVVTEGTPIWQLPPTDLLGVTAVSAGYLLFGYLAFRYAIAVSKRRGILGDY
ncbi:ABC transporter permease [Haloarcula sp. S1CR25-12]|uniref:ABC transporter permease n=1 Tax=Haloarcula saliterrae TaxID=2950534 RepID=A0ABU2FF26_9EURY|nr:ABC transporter permease [Haloarcula sp. S1CR25-12]MDS0260331.1 ABC transporter permease [Haloarcula sp. S1CR25-12]